MWERDPASAAEVDALRYRLLLEHPGLVLFQLDAQGRFTRLGRAWEAFVGGSVAEWLGRPLADAVHPEDRLLTQALLRTLVGREREALRHELRVRRGEGECWLELFARGSPAAAGEVVGTLTDITDRRSSEEAASTRERYLAAVLDVQRRLLAVEPGASLYDVILEPLARAAGASRVYIFEAHRGPAGQLLVSQKAEWCAPGVHPEMDNPEMQGFAIEEALGAEQTALLTGGQPVQGMARDFRPEFAAVLEAQNITSILLLPLRVHGQFFGVIGFDNCEEARPWGLLAVSLLVGAAGALSLALEQRSADAERVRTEATLRRTEADLHLLLEAFPDPVVVHEEGVLVYVNPATVKYLGYPDAEVMRGRPVLELLVPRAHTTALRHFVHAREAPARAVEVALQRRDGQQVVADLVTLGLLFEGKPALVTVARDFTERKRLQAQLMFSDRMAAMGTLAAGIAHELNNPLAYVLANLDFVSAGLESRTGPPPEEELDEWRQVLTETREGAERVRQIVRQLKAFSRVEEDRHEPVDLHRVLDSVAQMAGNEVRPRARLVKDFGTPPQVSGNEGKLFQIFLNLVINAAQAIPEGQAERNEIRLVTGADADGRAVVEVRDTGCGIKPEHLGRIFEPFFTTKPTGVGTGLGLSICHTLVCAAGGDIRVESTVGVGTTFRVTLPPAGNLPRVRREAAPQPVVAPTRVLIIDDEPAVATALGRLLEGHRVELAHTGTQGLEMLLRAPGYDVIFCDLMMPELSGMDLYEQVLAREPALAARFVFVTGGGFTPRARAFLAAGTHRVLDKPFDRDDVQRRVLEVLGLKG